MFGREVKSMIWAFNKADEKYKEKIYNIFKKEGKSRFGWSYKEEHNLLLSNNWTEEHSKQVFLLQIEPGDWIVHINTPAYGKCIAGKVISTYQFDEGIEVEWECGRDFRHNFTIDKETIVEFDRRDPNILPTVNLNPRQRYHRIYADEDFFKSIENLKINAVSIDNSDSKEEYYLKEKMEPVLEQIISLIQEMHKGKKLETFLAKVFRKIPGVKNVRENGFGWGTDYGADLIVTFSNTLLNIELETIVVVQIKSFIGEHYDLSAVGQVETGIEKYKANSGIIITTAKKTENLENEIKKISENINKPIDLISHIDLSKFILKYYPEILFKVD